MSQRIPPFAPSIAWYERALKQTQEEDDRDKTLFVQLTRYELLQIAFGLMWIGRVYGLPASAPLLKKFAELIRAQDFYPIEDGDE